MNLTLLFFVKFLACIAVAVQANERIYQGHQPTHRYVTRSAHQPTTYVSRPAATNYAPRYEENYDEVQIIRNKTKINFICFRRGSEFESPKETQKKAMTTSHKK